MWGFSRRQAGEGGEGMGGQNESHSICRKSRKYFTPGNLSKVRYWQFVKKILIDFVWELICCIYQYELRRG